MFSRTTNTEHLTSIDSGRIQFSETEQETFIPDDRAGLRPSEIVQSKLLKLIPEMPVPVSCLHTHRDTRRPRYSH